MSEPVFFATSGPITVAEVASFLGIEARGGDPQALIRALAPLDRAGAGDLSFLDNPAYAPQFRTTRASACLVAPRFAQQAPDGVAVLETRDPYRAFAQIAARLYPDAMAPGAIFGIAGVAPGAVVHPAARLEPGVTVDPGAVVGPRAEIGAGSVIGANAVIGPDVRIGRNCAIGPGASITHTLVGNNVILHQGVRIGQDGFGFAMGPRGHLKVPQIGRVVIQNDVEIGAGTCIDRGANRDTIIGEGTKIDNLVQIGHNVVVGRHCVIVAQCGIAGSSVLEDFVVLGGKVGVVGHVRIGAGAQIAATSNVNSDVPPGARWGGTPAKPVRDWFREIAALKRLARSGPDSEDASAV